MSSPSPEALVREFVRSFEERDLDAFVGLFAEDATGAFPFGAEPVRGRDRIRETFRRYFDELAAGMRRPVPPVTLDDLSVQALGDGGAIALFTYGTPPEIRRRTLVLRREPDGWCIAHVHGSNLDAE